jgi:hypothetical protein
LCLGAARAHQLGGAIQKVLDRVSQAIEPHYTAIATQTRRALVNYIDETPWFLTHTLQVMATGCINTGSRADRRAWHT